MNPLPSPDLRTADAPRVAAPASARAEGSFEPMARPIVFGDCLGYLHPAGGETGVIVCGGWGYEALCAHRAMAEFAEMLAREGYPTLRFDYPGAGNSRGDLDAHTLADWVSSVSAAAAALRKTSGARAIVLAGFGLGCLVALAAMNAGLAAAGVVLMGAPASGRRYIRETKAFAAMVAAPDDGGAEVASGALSIAGFVMPAAFVAEVGALDAARLAPPSSAFVIATTDPQGGSDALVDSLAAKGAKVDAIPFEGYGELLAGPIQTRTPKATFERALTALSARQPLHGAPATPAAHHAPAVFVDGDIVEEAVRFGEGERLFGVLCRPRAAAEGAPVAIMISVGRNVHTGWRRMPVENARSLAARGIASLRFDIGGIGESASREGQPSQMLYSDWPPLDLGEAFDFLEARRFGPITLVGICSGAYIGLQTAVADARVRGLVAVNLYRMVWNPTDSVERALRFGNRPMTAAVTRMFTRERIGKVLSGEIDARPGISHLLWRARRSLGVATMSKLGRVGPFGALYAECMRRFEILRARKVATVLAYSAGDEGAGEIEAYFGKGGRRLSDFPNVRVAVLDNCDHNFTPPRAAEWLVGLVEEIVRRTVARV
ncbi:MAG: alpha/beta fold hydrolase [Hyphomicrobiales bacterium]|nr:alpha/beta fold hydrolase [Hyphomicrobiales bacterium]